MDHVSEYRRPKDADGKEIIEKGCAPKTPSPSPPPSDGESEKEVTSSRKEKKKPKSKKHKDKKKKKKQKEKVVSDSDSDSGTDLPVRAGPNPPKERTPPTHYSKQNDMDSVEHNPSSHRSSHEVRRTDKPRIRGSECSKRYRDSRSPPRSKGRGRAEHVERRDPGARYRHRSRSRERRDARYSMYK